MRKELNAKEIRELAGKIEGQYGFKIDSKLKYYAKDEKEGSKIFMYTGARMPELPVEWIGLHFGTIIGEEFQPSIDGALLMNSATKNVVDVNRPEIEELMKGGEIEYKGKNTGFVIVKAGDLACMGRVTEGKITSLTPKSRLI